jgi:hypothetical protein
MLELSYLRGLSIAAEHFSEMRQPHFLEFTASRPFMPYFL